MANYLLTRKGCESAKVCGKCATTWKDSWLDNKNKNECPFCECVYDYRTATVVKLSPIKQKRIHWKDVSLVKLVGRLLSDITELDWKMFNNPSNYKLLQRRGGIVEKTFKKFKELVTQNRKTGH